jgi:hypothetical protein
LDSALPAIRKHHQAFCIKYGTGSLSDHQDTSFALDQGGLPWRLEEYADKLIQPYEGGLSCRVEPSFRLLHPLSSASLASRLFQLTPSHTEEALELVALAFTTVVSIAVGSTVVQPYAVAWR